MPRLIDADALIDLEEMEYIYFKSPAAIPFYKADAVWDVIEKAPTIDPESLRPKAAWKLYKDGSARCGKCRRTQMNAWDYDNYDRYCSSCGAKMRLKGEEDDG